MKPTRPFLSAMTALLACTGGCASASTPGASPIAAAQAESSEAFYLNASVWNGAGFDRRNLAIKDGRFVDPASLSEGTARIDLAGRFVVPAYGNAHCHLTAGTEEVSNIFLDSGVFYAWNPNTRVLDDAALAFIDRPETFDVLTAQGGITEPGGHPDVLYREILHDRVYPTWKDEDFVGNMYHYGRTREEIVAALDTLISQHAGFVKTYLLHSEDYERRKTDPQFHGRAGIDPLNLPFLVQEAEKRGLFVAAHIETVADLRAAAISGVAVAEHLPAYAVLATDDASATIALTAEDAALLKRAGMLAVPTYALAVLQGQGLEADALASFAKQREVTLAIQAENLKLLHAAGVPIIAGTDTGPGIFDEVEHWVKIGGLSTGEALAATLATGRYLFPDRRLGCFDTGCEADFLVLGANPLADITALRQIDIKVKAGRRLP
jgi:imidazolonepropionase-like amidohydrolase